MSDADRFTYEGELSLVEQVGGHLFDGWAVGEQPADSREDLADEVKKALRPTVGIYTVNGEKRYYRRLGKVRVTIEKLGE